MVQRENIFWIMFGDSLVEHPVITREYQNDNYIYYLFNKFKIYTKKIKNEKSIYAKGVEKDFSYKYKVSIIVPVYNVEKYLEKCLDSIINQTLKEIEIICINDGSTDSSLSVLEQYALKDSRIKIINQQNQGLSVARNNGLKYATGEYIGYVDSDDWISYDFYELLYNNAKKYNADIACGEIERPNADSIKLQKFFTIKNIKTSKKTRVKYKLCNIPKLNYVWNKIYKKEKLLSSRIEFPIGKKFEDIIWTHKVVDKLGKVVTVPNAVYYYRINNNSVTEIFDKKSRVDFYEANNDAVSYIVNNKIKSDVNSYTAKLRKKYILFGITLLDIKRWDALTVYRILGVPVFMSYRINN